MSIRAQRLSLVAAATMLLGLGLGGHTAGAAPAGSCVLDGRDRPTTITVLRTDCSREQQVDIFRSADVGERPDGVTAGWTLFPRDVADFAPWLWVGKSFTPGAVHNRVSILDVPAIDGTVGVAPSMIDGAPTWAIEYPNPGVSVFRDELREIAPGLYLGLGFLGGQLVTTFVLDRIG